MTDTDRITSALLAESDTVGRPRLPHEPLPLHTATVNTALLGVCPRCHRAERVEMRPANEVFMDGTPARMLPYGAPCRNEYHDHRERMEAAK